MFVLAFKSLEGGVIVLAKFIALLALGFFSFAIVNYFFGLLEGLFWEGGGGVVLPLFSSVSGLGC